MIPLIIIVESFVIAYGVNFISQLTEVLSKKECLLVEKTKRVQELVYLIEKKQYLIDTLQKEINILENTYINKVWGFMCDERTITLSVIGVGLIATTGLIYVVSGINIPLYISTKVAEMTDEALKSIVPATFKVQNYSFKDADGNVIAIQEQMGSKISKLWIKTDVSESPFMISDWFTLQNTAVEASLRIQKLSLEVKEHSVEILRLLEQNAVISNANPHLTKIINNDSAQDILDILSSIT